MDEALHEVASKTEQLKELQPTGTTCAWARKRRLR